MPHIGRARHPGPSPVGNDGHGHIRIEFVDVGAHFLNGDLALESRAHFQAVAQHRLCPISAHNIGTTARKLSPHAVRAPACRDSVVGRHPGSWRFQPPWGLHRQFFW